MTENDGGFGEAREPRRLVVSFATIISPEKTAAGAAATLTATDNNTSIISATGCQKK